MLVLIEDPKKPKIREPAKPNKEEENAVDIPSKGVSRPSCKLEKIKLVSWLPKLSPLITLLTEPTVPINPQNVPKRPKNIKSPIRYLDISLLSSKRPATPSNTDLNAAAEMEKFFKFGLYQAYEPRGPLK